MDVDVAGLLAQQEAAEAVAEERLARAKVRLGGLHAQLRLRSRECEALLRRRDGLRLELAAAARVPPREWAAVQRAAALPRALGDLQEDLRAGSAAAREAAARLRHELDEAHAALRQTSRDARKFLEEARARRREAREVEQSVDQLERHVAMQTRENRRLVSEREAFEAILRRTAAEASRAAQAHEAAVGVRDKLTACLATCEDAEQECNAVQARIDALERIVQPVCAPSAWGRLEHEVAALEHRVRANVGRLPVEILREFGALVEAPEPESAPRPLVDSGNGAVGVGSAVAAPNAESPERERNPTAGHLGTCLETCAQKLSALDRYHAAAVLREQHRTAQDFREFRDEMAAKARTEAWRQEEVM